MNHTNDRPDHRPDHRSDRRPILARPRGRFARTGGLLMLCMLASACDPSNADGLDAGVEPELPAEESFDTSAANELMTCWSNGIDLVFSVDREAAKSAVANCMVADAQMTFRFPGQAPIVVNGRETIVDWIADRWEASGYVQTQHMSSNVTATDQEGASTAYVLGVHNRPDSSSDMIGAAYDSEAVYVDERWLLVTHDARVTTFSYTAAPPAP